MTRPSTVRMNLSAGLASVLVAGSLVGLKLWAFGQTGALSVAASLADSAMDLMVSLGAMAAILYAAKPADEDHAFGHTSAEDLAALGQSVFIAIAAGTIAWSAAGRLLAPEPVALTDERLGIAIMGVSIVLTLGLVWWQGRVARRTGSRVVAADRLHYLGDLLPNIGSILSLWASSRFGLGSIDSVVALGAAAMLGLGAARIGKGAWDALMDRRADPEIVEGIGRIAHDWPGVHGFHDLKTRTAGSRVFVNIHIELDGDQSLRDAHAIGAGLRRAILTAYPQTDVIVHKDVADGDVADGDVADGDVAGGDAPHATPPRQRH
ncbi:cation diffusion facilitator family transporter [Rhodobacteraceae bacterium HSP-20]|uniref:Cation diffusion facilitator family transporter n=1 Tax=Paragemmobacter amnigenus TaxID=2852097 RepID=A0ABS6J218_9RHOB|nr:cation diffusion facilitator family transporter [Rhodobacter amnigenus]MBU9697567.1 cation diffusion facilitator family transporter [Rhodobacter amnigenus]MBV4388794.1 cation diffusion facilitator family transporter [Rhodobacter amnigenus]